MLVFKPFQMFKSFKTFKRVGNVGLSSGTTDCTVHGSTRLTADGVLSPQIN